MKLLDHILLNRSIAIITSFILGLLKIFAPHVSKPDNDLVIPRRRRKIFKPKNDKPL